MKGCIIFVHIVLFLYQVPREQGAKEIIDEIEELAGKI